MSGWPTAIAAVPVACEICACTPCLTPGFCQACRVADARMRPQQRTTELRRAAQSTMDALIYELRTYGIAQLAKPNCRRRLGDLSAGQGQELLAALLRLRSRYPAITDELILEIGDIYGA
jgi:hypothetical protein